MRESNKQLSRAAHGWLISLVAFAAICAIIFGARYFLESMQLAQNGLYPNLPVNSKILLYRRAYQSPKDIARGDYIVFRKDYQGRPIDFVWRVVGLPGEVISVADGRVVVDGQPFERERLRQDGDCQLWRESFGDVGYDVAECPATETPPSVEVSLGDGEVFVLGDNRRDALDSRSLGAVSFPQIRGKAVPFLNGSMSER